jgi:hypothetical protein
MARHLAQGGQHTLIERRTTGEAARIPDFLPDFVQQAVEAPVRGVFHGASLPVSTKKTRKLFFIGDSNTPPEKRDNGDLSDKNRRPYAAFYSGLSLFVAIRRTQSSKHAKTLKPITGSSVFHAIFYRLDWRYEKTSVRQRSAYAPDASESIMYKTLWARGAVVVACLSGMGVVLAADPVSAAGIAYVSGGIGDDDPVARMTEDYNLHLVFATKGSGEYLADIKVVIEDFKGNKVLEAESPGPIFYAKLPSGTYRITANHQGQPLRKSVAVKDHRLRDLYFYWASKEIPAHQGRS